jgi:hypothetical protein
MLTFIATNWRFVLAFAAMMAVFSGTEIYQRAAIEAHGVVVSSETSCIQPQNSRCDTVYAVEGADRSRTTLVAGPNDASLRRRLPVGTLIEKQRWALDYAVNGQPVGDFPTAFYGIQFVLAVIFALWSLLSSRRGT